MKVAYRSLKVLVFLLVGAPGFASTQVKLFVASDCPQCLDSRPAFSELVRELRQRKIDLQVIFPHFDENRADATRFASQIGVSEFSLSPKPVVWKQYGVERVPTAIVLDSKNQVIYKGPVELRSGNGKVRQNFVFAALDRLGQLKPADVDRVPAQGCLIREQPDLNEITDEQIVTKVRPILDRFCMSCHDTGGTAPISFGSSNEIRRWRSMIEDVVATQKMPPRSTFSTVDMSRPDSMPVAARTALLKALAGVKNGFEPLEKPVLTLRGFQRELSPNKSIQLTGEAAMEFFITRHGSAPAWLDSTQLIPESRTPYLRSVRILTIDRQVAQQNLPIEGQPYSSSVPWPKFLSPKDLKGSWQPDLPFGGAPLGRAVEIPENQEIVVVWSFRTYSSAQTVLPRVRWFQVLKDSIPTIVPKEMKFKDLRASSLVSWRLVDTVESTANRIYGVGLASHGYVKQLALLGRMKGETVTRTQLLSRHSFFQWPGTLWFQEPLELEPKSQLALDLGFVDASLHGPNQPEFLPTQGKGIDEVLGLAWVWVDSPKE